MRKTPSSLPEVLLIDLDVFADERGHLVEVFNEKRFAEHGLPTTFRQDNLSRSLRGVIRGLHYQLQHPQGKLISCIRGRIFDIAVDIRMGSPTFGKWVGVELSEDERQLVWIPPGFAHGYCTLSEIAEIQYKCTDLYAPRDERGILWSDPDLAIAWPSEHPILSKRDRDLPTLRAALRDLPQYTGVAPSDAAR